MSRPTLEGIAVAAVVIVALCAAAADLPMGFDEGIWFHVVRAWVDDGVPPYQGPIENKPPGIFYLFALAYAVAGVDETLPRAAGILALLGTVGLCAALARRFGGRDAGLAAALVAGCVLASSAVDGVDTSATESFMILGTTAAVTCARAARELRGGARGRWLALAGAALGAALAFKQTALVTAPAVLAFAWPSDAPTPGAARRTARDAAWVAGGFVAATVVFLVPLLAAGVSLREYAEGAWLILLDPGSRVPTPALPRLVTDPLWLTPVAGLLAVAAVFVALRKPLERRGVPWTAIVVWMAVDIAGSFASGSFFAHQLKQLVPATAVAAGILVALLLAAGARQAPAWLGPWDARRASGAALALLALALLPASTVANRIVSTPRTDRARAAHLELARWIREHSDARDPVFTFIGGGLAQAVAERPSPSRYFNRNFIKSDAAIRAVLHDLDARPPRIVVIEHVVPAWLADYLTRDYARTHTVDRYLIFERRRDPA